VCPVSRRSLPLHSNHPYNFSCFFFCAKPRTACTTIDGATPCFPA
jgi:hypothetical protein